MNEKKFLNLLNLFNHLKKFKVSLAFLVKFYNVEWIHIFISCLFIFHKNIIIETKIPNFKEQSKSLLFTKIKIARILIFIAF